MDVFLGYESLTYSANSSGEKFAFAGPRAALDISFLFKKKFSLGLYGEAKVLNAAYTKESGETETATSFGGGFNFAYHFGKKKNFFFKTDIGYAQTAIETSNHDFLKSYSYPTIVLRFSSGYVYIGKKVSFTVAPSLEINSLSSGSNVLYPDQPISDLLGIGGSFNMALGYVF